jgi:hypothetical protein
MNARLFLAVTGVLVSSQALACGLRADLCRLDPTDGTQVDANATYKASS